MDGISPRLLVRGFPAFGRMLLTILRQRGRFIVNRPADTSVMLTDAGIFAFYAACISFLFLIPPMIQSGNSMSKWTWLTNVALFSLLGGTILHLSCKLARGRGSLKESFACYLYSIGSVPLFTLVAWPMLALTGASPAALVGDRTNLQRQIDAALTSTGASVVLGVVAVLLYTISLTVTCWCLLWLARVHALSNRRMFLLVVPVAVVGFSLLGDQTLALLRLVAGTVGDVLGRL